MMGAGAFPHTPRLDPRLLCTWYSQALCHPGASVSRKRGEWQAEWATPRFFARTKVAWRRDKRDVALG